MASLQELQIRDIEQRIDPLRQQLQEKILLNHFTDILIATTGERDRDSSLFLDGTGNWDHQEGEEFTLDDLLAKFARITDPGYNAILDADLEDANREYQDAGDEINNRIRVLFNKKLHFGLTEDEQVFYDKYFVIPTKERNARFTRRISEYLLNPENRLRLLRNLSTLMEFQIDVIKGIQAN